MDFGEEESEYVSAEEDVERRDEGNVDDFRADFVQAMEQAAEQNIVSMQTEVVPV